MIFHFSIAADDPKRTATMFAELWRGEAFYFPMVGEGGTIEWPKIMRLLKSRGDQYPLLLELKERVEVANPLDAVREIFQRLEALRYETE